MLAFLSLVALASPTPAGPCIVSGKVTSLASDQALPAVIRARAVDRQDNVTIVHAAAAKDGAFSLQLPRGTVVYLSADADGHFSGAAHLLCRETTKPEVLELRLRFADVKLEGLVVDKDGRPVVGALVTASNDIWWHTDAAGRFSTWIGSDGTELLMVNAPSFATAFAAVRAPRAPHDRIRIELRPATTLSLEEPCVWANFGWRTDGDDFETALLHRYERSKTARRVVVEVPPAKQGRLIVTGCAFGESSTVTLAEGESRSIVVATKPSRKVSGRVVIEGRPASLKRLQAKLGGHDLAWGMTNEAGEFTFLNLPGEALRIEVEDETIAGSIDVAAGASRAGLVLTATPRALQAH